MSLVAGKVVVGYGGNTVLYDVSAAVEPGNITMLIGPNGSGKSTLIRTLAYALKPETGTVTVDGKNLYRMRAKEAAKLISFVPQENWMGYAFTVGELVGLGTLSKGDRSAENTENTALALLELTHLKEKSVLALSGGERQRAAIARGIAQNSRYLLLDEPTAHLDLRHQVLLLGALRKMADYENKGILLVLHDLNLAAEWADTILLMNSGRIVAAGSSQNVMTADKLEEVYQTPITIVPHPVTGSPWVVPR